MQLLNHFKGRVVPIGTSRTMPPKHSVGEWLIKNKSKQAIASYIGAILVSEGYVEKVGRSELSFR